MLQLVAGSGNPRDVHAATSPQAFLHLRATVRAKPWPQDEAPFFWTSHQSPHQGIFKRPNFTHKVLSVSSCGQCSLHSCAGTAGLRTPTQSPSLPHCSMCAMPMSTISITKSLCSLYHLVLSKTKRECIFIHNFYSFPGDVRSLICSKEPLGYAYISSSS